MRSPAVALRDTITGREVPVARTSAFVVAAAVVTALLFIVHIDLAVPAVIISVTALTFASIQYRDAKNTLEKLDALAGRLDDAVVRLEGEVSTRRLDVFPAFMPTIVRLLEEVDEERGSIRIFCDFPAYATFSNLREYQRYSAVIQEKAKVVPVELVCLNEVRRRKLSENQIIHNGGWEMWVSDPRMVRLLAVVSKRLGEVDSLDALVDLLEMCDQKALQHTFGQAKRCITDEIMPVAFWVVDGQKAVFALQPFKQEAVAVGFLTHDSALVEALNGIFDRYVMMSTTPGSRLGACPKT